MLHAAAVAASTPIAHTLLGFQVTGLLRVKQDCTPGPLASLTHKTHTLAGPTCHRSVPLPETHSHTNTHRTTHAARTLGFLTAGLINCTAAAPVLERLLSAPSLHVPSSHHAHAASSLFVSSSLSHTHTQILSPSLFSKLTLTHILRTQTVLKASASSSDSHVGSRPNGFHQTNTGEKKAKKII